MRWRNRENRVAVARAVGDVIHRHDTTTAAFEYHCHIDAKGGACAHDQAAGSQVGATAWRGMRDDVDRAGRLLCIRVGAAGPDNEQRYNN
jgi:hypothetical protein